MPRGKFAKAKSAGDRGKRREFKSDSRRKDERRAEIFNHRNALPPLPRPESRRKKPTKREVKRRLRDSADIPGLDAIISDEVRQVRVGFGFLQFICPHRDNESDVSSADDSLHGSNTEANQKEDNEDPTTGVKSEKTKPSEPTSEGHTEEDFISLGDSSDGDDSFDMNARSASGLSAITIEADPTAPWWPPSKNDKTSDNGSQDESESEDEEQDDYAAMTGSEQVGEELLEYLRYVSPQPHEANCREATIKRLRRVVQQVWRTANVSVFGSHATGMYLPDADIDVVISSDELKAKIRQEMHRLAARLKSNRLTDAVQVISHARVPIVKYIESGSNANVDIAFGQTGGSETARLVTSWLQAFPVLKPMGMFVRQFSKQRKLSDVANGGLGGYAMMCMMYSRLRYVLAEFPSIFEASEVQEENAVTVSRNGGLLLVDFFDYYGNEFDNTLMAVRCTEPFKPFYKRANSDMNTPQAAGLAIEDPQNRQNNISKASYNYPTVKRSFQNAADVLKSLLSKRHRHPQSISGTNIFPESLLGPLLKYSGDEPLRGKVGLDVALNVPDLSPDNTFEEPVEVAQPKPTRKDSRYQKKVERSQTSGDAAKIAAQNVASRKGRESKQRGGNADRSKPVTQKKSSPATENSGATATSTTSTGKRNIDPWKSDLGNPKQRKTQSDSDHELDEASESASTSHKSVETEVEDDSADSRVRMTTAERRQFWKSKAGTPEQPQQKKDPKAEAASPSPS